MKDIQMKPKQWLKAPRHSRRRLDDSKLRHLADNIEAIGLLNPIECLPCGEIISGFHRWLAVMLKDRITEVPVRIVADPLDAKQLRVRRVSENLQRSDLTFVQKYEECQGFREDEPGITAKEIAELLNVDPSTITRYLCLNDCVEAVRKAAEDELISMRVCYEISKAAPEDQAALLAQALGGSADEVAREGRKRRNGAAAAVRTTKIKCPLPSGHVVTVAGDEISLEEAIEVLGEAIKAMRHGVTKRMTAKTFQSAMKDMTKTG